MAINNWIEAGALIRGALRRELVKAGVEYTETKTLTASIFVIPNYDHYEIVRNSLEEQGLLQKGE